MVLERSEMAPAVKSSRFLESLFLPPCGGRPSCSSQNTLRNQYGLDVDAAGASIGWAMECFQRRIIDEKVTGVHTTGEAIIETIGGSGVEKAEEVCGIDNPHKPQEI